MNPGPFPLDGVKMPTWLLRFDKHGACISPETRAALMAHLASTPKTDVVVFSHGWNNDFEAAGDLYREFLQRFEAIVAQHAPGRAFDPLFVGTVWPSTWLVFDKGPTIAAEGASPAADPAMMGTVADMAERLASQGSTSALERFYALLEKKELSGEEAKSFAALVAPVFGTIVDEETGGTERPAGTQTVLDMLQAAEALQRPGGAQAPNLDEWGTAPTAGTGAGPSAAGLLDKLDPRNAVRLFSLYQMKDRAGTVGYNGVAALLRDLLAASAAADSKVHAIGHSFGCKVMLSAICAPQEMPRPLTSLLLLQPAISYLCFAESVPKIQKPGGYRRALDPKRVRAPIFSTYSKLDFPLHETFHLALRRSDDAGEMQIAAEVPTSAGEPPSLYAALGGFGPRGAGQKLLEPLPAAGDPYPADLGAPIVSFDGSQGVISGHGDVKSAATAWALHRLAFR